MKPTMEPDRKRPERRTDTRAIGSYDPLWEYMWQAWMTVLEKAAR